MKWYLHRRNTPILVEKLIFSKAIFISFENFVLEVSHVLFMFIFLCYFDELWTPLCKFNSSSIKTRPSVLIAQSPMSYFHIISLLIHIYFSCTCASYLSVLSEFWNRNTRMFHFITLGWFLSRRVRFRYQWTILFQTADNKTDVIAYSIL